MSEEKKYELKQVSVRLRLSEEPPLYSTQEINSPRRAVDVMRDLMMQLDRENIAIIHVDNGGRPISFDITNIGNLNSCQFTMRELFKSAILQNSAQILILHNHPGYRTEKPKPSREDDITTLRVMLAGEFMGIPLMDHVIVSGGTGSCYSYKAEYGDRFNIEDFQKCFGENAIEGMLCESKCEYIKTSEYNSPIERPSVREIMRGRKAGLDEKNKNILEREKGNIISENKSEMAINT